MSVTSLSRYFTTAYQCRDYLGVNIRDYGDMERGGQEALAVLNENLPIRAVGSHGKDQSG
jgi:hypothetical protein